MQVQLLKYMQIHLRKYSLQVFVLVYCFGLGMCMSPMPMSAMSASARRDFSDLDSAEAAVPRHPVIRNSENVERVMFNLNDPKELVCSISGTPTPTVVWMKANQKNLDPVYFTPSFDPRTGTAKLSISSSTATGPRQMVAKFLSGSYTCFAANFLGQTQKTFQVQVT